MNALIVDDEPKARRILEHQLAAHCPGLHVQAGAENVPAAVREIQRLQPDIVFLDIDMPGQDGFALFDYFTEVPFQVIFVTASRDHALDAFKVSAVDYLLKPIDADQLVKAVEKARQIRQPMLPEQIHMLNKNLHAEAPPKRLALSLTDRVEFVQVHHIIYLKAEGSYTEFYLGNEKKLVVSKPLGEYDMLERHPQFMKTHRSYLINLQQVASFKKDSGGYILMQNGHSVNLSRYKKEAFLQAMAHS